MFTICSFYLCLNPLLLGEEWRLDTRLNSEETRPNKGQFTILSDDSLSFTLFLLEHQIFHPDLSTLTQLLCNLVSSQAKQIEDGIPILLATPALIVVFSFRLTLLHIFFNASDQHEIQHHKTALEALRALNQNLTTESYNVKIYRAECFV